MHENRMDTGDFYDLACFNCFSYFTGLGQISGRNRHQRHQGILGPLNEFSFGRVLVCNRMLALTHRQPFILSLSS